MSRIGFVIALAVLGCGGGGSEGGGGGTPGTVAFSDSVVGLDINQPVSNSGEILPNTEPNRIASTGTAWARVDFIGGYYSAYDEIINTLLAKGVKIYLLCGSGIVGDPGDLLRSYPASDPAAADAWISNYAAKFVEAVDHFKDRVRVFETFNEPNDWAGGTTAKVHPYWMAKILQELYLNTKSFNGHAGVAAWQVTIVSGPLFSFDGNDSSGYLKEVYSYGKNPLAWDWTREHTGSYPLDGVGYHLYVAQSTTQYGEIVSRIDGHLSAIWGVMSTYGETSKKIWVSEIGWPSSVSETYEAEALGLGLSTLKSDARLALACAFCLHDFPGGDWGLYRSDWTPKPSLDAFKAQSKP